jgi:hypothetical protein
LLPFIAAQVPDASVAEHEQVGHRVIDNLINVGSLDRGFAVDYGALAPDGRYQRRRFDFKLLVEVAAPDGRRICGRPTRRSRCSSVRWTPMWSPRRWRPR